MNEDLVLDEQTIGDIILCEPITGKGEESLNNLGLTDQDISPSYFYDEIRATPKYDTNKICDNIVTNYAGYGLYYQYAVDYIQFQELQARLQKFNARFCSDAPNEYPLFVIGVAGNGKSIELNRHIYEIISDKKGSSIYFDLEKSFTKLDYGKTFICPENTPLWLFCIKIMQGIMEYIRQNHILCPTIYDNFIRIIAKENLSDKKQIEIFENIGLYSRGDNDVETEIFSRLIGLVNPERPDISIQNLVDVLMRIMYCSAPEKKQYIIIDNIEQYINLDFYNIQILDSDISMLYTVINSIVMNITNAFNRIEKNLGWKAFKMIIALRRTTWLLNPTLLHSTAKVKENTTDMTGYFQVPDIWEKKKEHIWENHLEKKFVNAKNKDIIDIVDIIMKDGDKAIGANYQSLIAPLMSYGIRRNAKAQAHAAFETYKVLTDEKQETISLSTFYQLKDAMNRENTTIRFMFRRALMEFQFKWSISSENQERWKWLGLGYLTGAKEHFVGNQKTVIEGVAYSDQQCVTLVRRILTCLSHSLEGNNPVATGQHKSIADMFATISLYDLMVGVLVNPRHDNEILDDDLIQFARVLIALGNMSNTDTKCAPYVILNIKDVCFHDCTAEADLVLAGLLRKILNAQREKSLPGEIYNCSDFGARITDAGYSFLLDWQASFSFMSSLYCFTIPPLFFLKDVSSIQYVIKTVYEASAILCEKYEAEAERFCAGDIYLTTGTYLPKINGRYVTFRARVKDLHMRHLDLYRTYVMRNYKSLEISEKDMLNLTNSESGFISKYINMYSNWNTEEGLLKCF